MKVRDILKTKGPEVFTIGEDKALSEAISILVNNKIGVLLVLNNEAKIIGILSERDIIKEGYNKLCLSTLALWVRRAYNDTAGMALATGLVSYRPALGRRGFRAFRSSVRE